MNNGTKRIDLIVTDIIERMDSYNYIKIVRKYSTLYLGYYNKIPKELLNEKVIRIRTLDCTDVPLLIEIE